MVVSLLEAIDPYGIYDKNLFNLKYSFATNVLCAKRLIEILHNERNILVFGTSRSARISPAILHEEVINLDCIYGNPSSVIDFLNRLDQQSIKNISKIYYCIDWNCFIDDSKYDRVNYQDWKAILIYKIKHLNLSVIGFAQQKIFLNFNGEPNKYYHSKGYAVRHNDGNPNFPIIPYNDVEMTSKDIVSVLSKIDKFAKTHSIEIVYFMPTLPAGFDRLWDFGMFSRQLRLYLDYIDGIYDFTYVEGISNNRQLFADYSHLSTNGLKKLFETQFNEKNYITSKNLDAHLSEYKKYYKYK
jgi:hypothetical protein